MSRDPHSLYNSLNEGMEFAGRCVLAGVSDDELRELQEYVGDGKPDDGFIVAVIAAEIEHRSSD